MCPHEVTRDENLDEKKVKTKTQLYLELRDVRHHRVWPVDERGREKLDGVVTNRKLKARGCIHFFHFCSSLMRDVEEVVLCDTRGNHSGVGENIKQLLERTRVIRFSVVENDVLHFVFGLEHRFDTGNIL
jgi:hypothetical protein